MAEFRLGRSRNLVQPYSYIQISVHDAATPPEALCNINVKSQLYQVEHVVTKQLRSESGELCCWGSTSEDCFKSVQELKRVNWYCVVRQQLSQAFFVQSIGEWQRFRENVTQCNGGHIECFCLTINQWRCFHLCSHLLYRPAVMLVVKICQMAPLYEINLLLNLVQIAIFSIHWPWIWCVQKIVWISLVVF